VSASDDRVKEDPGAPETPSFVAVSVERIDTCTATVLQADGFAFLEPADFQIDDNLNSATLDTTIELTDLNSGVTFSVEVNLRWAGTGRTTTETIHEHIEQAGYKVIQRGTATVRAATATGTVTDGTTNFTPEPASEAALASIKDGVLEITHL
jgi:hypothetical protein